MHMPPFRAQRFDMFYLFSWSENFCFNLCFKLEECVVVEYITTKNGHFDNLQLSEWRNMQMKMMRIFPYVYSNFVV